MIEIRMDQHKRFAAAAAPHRQADRAERTENDRSPHRGGAECAEPEDEDGNCRGKRSAIPFPVAPIMPAAVFSALCVSAAISLPAVLCVSPVPRLRRPFFALLAFSARGRIMPRSSPRKTGPTFSPQPPFSAPSASPRRPISGRTFSAPPASTR